MSGWIPQNADYLVNGYDAQGNILVGTWHIGEASRDMEIGAWKARYERGDKVARVDVIDRNTGKMESYPPWPDRPL